jgi:hypothetical protein
VVYKDEDAYSSHSDSEEKHTRGADRLLKLLARPKRGSKKRIYNFYEEISLRQLSADLRKRQDVIVSKGLGWKRRWPKKLPDQAEPSRPAPTDDQEDRSVEYS